jgi:UDP-glucose 4-epimerase
VTDLPAPLVVVGGCGRVGRRLVDLALTMLPTRPLVSVDRVSPPVDRTGVLDLRGDAANPSEDLGAALRELGAFDLVILNALIPSENGKPPSMEALLEANAIGAVAIAHACHAHLRKVVFASSVEVYGPAINNALFREDQPVAPATAYGVSKLAGELTLAALCRELGLPCVQLRFSSIYGSRPLLGNAMEGFFTQASGAGDVTVFGDGSARRDFVHVDDAAYAIAAALRYPTSGIFNIAHPQVLTLGDLAQLAVEVVGAGTVVYSARRGPVGDRAMDTTRMMGLLKFEPSVDAALGLQRLNLRS